MFEFIMILVALLIPCVFLTDRRSDAEDVTANNKPTTNNKPTANNNADELYLGRSLGIEHAREMIDEDDWATSIAHQHLDQQPEKDRRQDDDPFLEQEQEPKRSIIERAAAIAIKKTRDV